MNTRRDITAPPARSSPRGRPRMKRRGRLTAVDELREVLKVQEESAEAIRRVKVPAATEPAFVFKM